jgi:sorbitol-specific phosphotransferase system component IIBC
MLRVQELGKPRFTNRVGMKMRFVIAVFFVAKTVDQFHKAIVPMSYINPVDVSFYAEASLRELIAETLGKQKDWSTSLPTLPAPCTRSQTPQINIVPAYEQKGRSSPKH